MPTQPNVSGRTLREPRSLEPTRTSTLLGGRASIRAQLLTSDHTIHPETLPEEGTMRIRLVVAGLACCVALGQARAQNLGPTLQKIKDSGTISLGHRESSIPFSYYDDKQQVVGYSHELMLKAVDAVKK